ncbi:MAG: phenylacetate--CoA ligase [Bacteroidales bacterium]|nr:phenylacetate--CoA ligase [Bacteroidales bacterium]
MMWNKKLECMPREELTKLQSERLVKIVKYTYDNVKYYHDRMDFAGVKPSDIKGIEDISKLPFMTKQDLRDYYPTGTFAAPMSDIVRFHASSGTTGKPIVAGYTQHDLECWSEGVARCLTAYGLTKKDIVQVAYGYGLFTGGLGAHDGATKVGCSVLPASSGNTAKQLLLMKDLGVTALCCTPSYALFLAESLHKSEDFKLSDMKLKAGVFGAEPWSENMRAELEEKLGIKAYDIYGLTEVSGPGVGGECECQDGTHLWEDMFYPEIIDPVTLQPMPHGAQGELVFTTLTKEGMPVIRYRTRDLTSLNYEPCKCGRTAVRMNKIMGRTDDMLIIRGVNVFPTQIESVIMEFPECNGQYLIKVDRKDNTDTFGLDIELRPDCYSDSVGRMNALTKSIIGRIASVIGIKCDVKVVEPNSIERSAGKAKHVIDLRKI